MTVWTQKNVLGLKLSEYAETGELSSRVFGWR